MPSGEQLSPGEKGKIIAYNQMGLSNREIGRRISRSHKVINSFLIDPTTYGTKNNQRGRQKKLTPREERIVVRKASNEMISLKTIRDDLQLNVCRETIRQTLKRSGKIVSAKLKKSPKLTSQHKANRMNFAQRHLIQQTDWSKIIFSDEKHWTLDGPDGNLHYWHDLRKEERVFSKRGHWGGGVMVWAAFCADGTVGIELGLKPKINSTDYQAVLNAKLLSYLNTAGNGYVFQHDNAPIHASISTTRWLAAMNVTVLDWPANSPDLNPIENLWGVLVRRVYSQGRQFASLNDLKNAILQE